MPNARLLTRCLPALAATVLGLLAAGPVRAEAPAWPGNPFAAASVWNAPLAGDAPLAADSRPLVAHLADQATQRHGLWINTSAYGVPVYVVGRHQPTVHITLDTDRPLLQQAFDAVPVPPAARAAAGTDQHMTVWQPSTDRLWDFWLMHRAVDGWHARWGGAMEHVSRNPGYFVNEGARTNWGARATGIPLLAGLITDEDLRRGSIDHALAIAVPDAKARVWSWPAQRTDGVGHGRAAIPEGTEFRLDPRLKLARLTLSPLARMIARAAQRYGIVVVDQGGSVAFFGQAPTAAANPWTAAFEGHYPNQMLAGFPWRRLRVIRAPTHCCRVPH